MVKFKKKSLSGSSKRWIQRHHNDDLVLKAKSLGFRSRAVFKLDELVIPNKNFDSKVEDTIVGKLSIREIELDTPFSITASLVNDTISISGFTEIDTTWFGFDAPTKFNAWEVLNPIGITVDLVAKQK